MDYKRVLAVCFLVMLGAPTADAHHAWAAVFTDEVIEIEGYVTEYNFKNPHVNIMLSVTDEDGVETEWMATGPAAPVSTLGLVRRHASGRPVSEARRQNQPYGAHP